MPLVGVDDVCTSRAHRWVGSKAGGIVESGGEFFFSEIVSC